MFKTLMAASMWITLLAMAGEASAQNYLPAADSGYNNLNSFISGTDYVYSASVTDGGSYAGISSTVGSGVKILGSTATLVGGSNSSGATAAVTMQWRNRAEVESTGQHPPLPDGSAYLASDVLNLQGVSGAYALQMNYSPNVECIKDAQVDAIKGDLYLGWFNTDTGYWCNAADTSLAGGANAKGPFQGSFTDFLKANKLTSNNSLTGYVGYWGVNIDGLDDIGEDNTVWAIVDSLNGQFAVVPEPGTFAMIGAGTVVLLPVLLRRKLKQLRQRFNS